MVDRYQFRDTTDGTRNSREFQTSGPGVAGAGVGLDSNGLISDDIQQHRLFFYLGDTIPPPVPADAPSQYRLVQVTSTGDILRWIEDGT